MIDIRRARVWSFPAVPARAAHIGFAIACLSGLAGLVTVSFPPVNPLLGALTLLIVPFALVYLVTKSIFDSLTLVWVSEVFFGGGGPWWAQVGPLSVRWTLFAAVMALTAVRILASHRTRLSSKVTLLGRQVAGDAYTVPVLLYGLVLPSWLVAYSVIGQGTAVARAVGDVDFLYALLAYFPMRLLLRRHLDLFQGWIIGGVVVLSLFCLFLSFAPMPLAGDIFLAVSGQPLNRTEAGTNRAALLTLVLLFIGIFLGLLYAVDLSKRMTIRLAGVALMCVSISSLIVDFVRGPLLSVALIMVALALVTGLRPSTRTVAVGSLTALVCFTVIAFGLYATVIPEGLNYFLRGRDTGLAGFVDPVRIEQAGKMAEALESKPVLGQGVGIPVSGFTPQRSLSGYELQYLMLLYRLGIVNFLLLVLPLVWFFVEPFRLLRRHPDILGQRAGKLAVAMLLAVLTTMIAGAMNPYITAVFTPLMIVVYLSSKELCTGSQASIAVPSAIAQRDIG